MTEPGGHDGVRRAYDTVAEEYAARLHDELDGKPLDRALLATVLELAGPAGTVADLGCGPGHVAAWLAGRGARTVGVDLSSRMTTVGRARYPGVEFRQGDLLALPADDRSFDAAVALYSIIHLAPAELPRAFAEVRRVLRPGGTFLVSFHVGDEVRHLDSWWGRAVDLDFRFLDPADVARLLGDAGFTVRARTDRAPEPHEAPTHRAYLLARRE
ncbi:class I SAM-dependent methyltransferase [Streptomyces sp. RFCAC02]|uniref:class I SAM-dependent methyltransferase n=1 Tax=Streptomyces sp. RFCAC02 TaxID=2499143 RepID=UPI00101FAED8|nr:class I SAM-dependent methyltransferase [Streptomyces sp. RFCAC02]